MALKVNFILPFFSVRPIGGLKVAYEYANELAARGYEVSVIHPRFLRSRPRQKNSLGRMREAAVHGRNYFSPRSGLSWQPLRDEIRLLFVREPTAENIPDADLVFATAWQTAEYVAEYPAPKGRKFYLVMDFPPWIAPKEVLERTWSWPLMKITISKWLYDQVRATGCPTSQVAKVPIGINFDRFHLTSDIAGRPKKILMLYSSSPSKGSEDGLKALAECKAEHPDLEIGLFGPAFRRRPPNLPEWASYRGNISDGELRQLYNGSRIYLCSSRAEGFALPPAEAMACGCAVTATDCGGIREFAIDGDNALLSPAGDAETLARNILRLLADDELRVRLASRGRDSIQRFTWRAATDQLESIIHSNTQAFRAAS
jgi:glycosyltransferase involved in cell wall biosynthesis